MERWQKGGERRTGLPTVPTAEGAGYVDLWDQGVETEVSAGIDAGLAWEGFATGRGCPLFAHGCGGWWKSGWGCLGGERAGSLREWEIERQEQRKKQILRFAKDDNKEQRQAIPGMGLKWLSSGGGTKNYSKLLFSYS